MSGIQTYLSVDVDYWSPWEQDVFSEEMDLFFDKIIESTVPVHIVKDHEELVRHVDKFNWTHLVNIDKHADIVTCKEINGEVYDCKESAWIQKLEFNCGTWANFVNGRHDGTFIWQYPVDSSYYCKENRSYDYLWEVPKKHNWKSIKAQKGIDIMWDTVVACGIALSHEWLTKSLFEYFTKEIYPKLLEAGGKESFLLKNYLIKVAKKEKRVEDYYKLYT